MRLYNLTIAILLALTVGCATETKKKVEKDIATQQESSPAQAADSGRQAIFQSDKLTSEQKDKMLAIMNQAQTEMAAFRESEGQIKSSLFKYLAEGKFGKKEISVYRSKLVKLENKKMDLMFTNLSKVREILAPGSGREYDPELMDIYRVHTAW